MRKDNTIWYEGNRYTVPLGTYDGTDKIVAVRVSEENRLIIYEEATGRILAEHPLCVSKKGELVRNNHHGRDRSKDIQAYLDHVAKQFHQTEKARDYLEEIRRQKPRYIRDQLQAIEKELMETEAKVADQALTYCLKYKLYRATDVTDAIRHFKEQQQGQVASQPEPMEPKLLNQVETDKMKTKAQIRDFEIYRKILRGGNA